MSGYKFLPKKELLQEPPNNGWVRSTGLGSLNHMPKTFNCVHSGLLKH